MIPAKRYATGSVTRPATPTPARKAGTPFSMRKPTAKPTALMMAAGYGYTPIVELLLERGADPRARSRDGVTALSAAAGGVADGDRFTLGACQASTVKALLARDPGLRLPRDFWGRAARVAARLRGCNDLLAQLP